MDNEAESWNHYRNRAVYYSGQACHTKLQLKIMELRKSARQNGREIWHQKNSMKVLIWCYAIGFIRKENWCLIGEKYYYIMTPKVSLNPNNEAFFIFNLKKTIA
jgi:hypothetical protein